MNDVMKPVDTGQTGRIQPEETRTGEECCRGTYNRAHIPADDENNHEHKRRELYRRRNTDEDPAIGGRYQQEVSHDDEHEDGFDLAVVDSAPRGFERYN